jgi:pSer/pThr/pTyr-binding forkhead associated (FHA) protein
MVHVTIQVLEGVERGRIYADLPTPVTIGREDDNAIRLNDERVSRFHAKIQEDGGRVIFTDLDSTNGSRINGRPVQMKVLAIGDQLMIGRCLLIFGSSAEIASEAAEHARRRREASPSDDQTLAGGPTSGSKQGHEASANYDSSSVIDGQVEELFPGGPPECPQGLTALQRAQISDQFAFIHEQIRKVIEAAQEYDELAEPHEREMRVDWTAWQQLVHLEMNLAQTLRQLADPDA